MKSKVALISCKDYNQERVFACVEEAVDLIGGIGLFIKPGDTVLLKPNLLSARPPESCICTHPEFVRAVIRVVKKSNPAKILIGDSPGAYENRVDHVYQASGIKDVARDEGAQLVFFDKYVLCDGIPISNIVEDKNVKIINLPKFKTHNLTVITGALKNTFGLVPGVSKVECHKKYFRLDKFNKMLVAIFKKADPVLSIMDGIAGMEGDGPANGSVRNFGLVFASADAVALDTLMAHAMGISPKDVPMISFAAKEGLGVCDMRQIEILGLAPKDIPIRDFKKPRTNAIYKYLPEWVVGLISIFLKIIAEVDSKKCVACGVCVRGCPVGAISIVNKIAKIDYKKCITCFCCREFCPHNAINAKEPFVIRLLRRKRKDAHTHN